MDNVACYMYRNDLRGGPGRHPERGDVRDRVHRQRPAAADHGRRGRRRVLPHGRRRGLAAALSQAFVTIEKRVAAGTSVSVVSAEDRINNRLFRARYESQSWRGYVEAFELPVPRRHGGPVGGRRAAGRTRPRYAHAADLDHRDEHVRLHHRQRVDARTLLGRRGCHRGHGHHHLRARHAIEGTRDRDGWILGDIVDSVAAGRRQADGLQLPPRVRGVPRRARRPVARCCTWAGTTACCTASTPPTAARCGAMFPSPSSGA